MKLIGSTSSPFVRKARVVLHEKKVDYQFELVDVWSKDSRVHEINPLGQVPCLVMEDGGALFDSRVIVEYVDTMTPVGRLLPTSSRERATVKCWEALADGVSDAAVRTRLERQRPKAQQSPEWIERQWRKVEGGVRVMAAGLAERKWCLGNAMTLADIALVVTLDYLSFRFPEFDWRSEYPGLAALSATMLARPSFQATTPT